LVLITMLIFIQFFFYGDVKRIKALVVIQLSFMLSLFFFFWVKVDEEEQQLPYGIIVLLASVAYLILIWYRNSDLSLDLFSHFTSWKEEQVDFKNIFDNLEDPVVIYQDSTCKFANDSFLAEFEHHIMGSTITIEETSQPTRTRFFCFKKQSITSKRACSSFFEMQIL
jgi:hypothetical protein